MTVREVFDDCYPGVPEDASIHMSGLVMDDIGIHAIPWYIHNGRCHRYYTNEGWGKLSFEPFGGEGPDIADRPASSFIGFFGPEFDAVVEGGK